MRSQGRSKSYLRAYGTRGRRSSAKLAVVGGVAAAMIAVTAPSHAQPASDEFRVNPYLQNPSSDGMTITWFTADPAPGELVVRGPGLGKGVRYTTEPTYEDVLDYTEAELSQQIDGLDQGSWLHEGGNYKHTVDVTDLSAGKRYRYSVRSGDAEYTAHFETAPTSDKWHRIRFVALSDSETQPEGRVLRREWAPGALADEGLDRPSAAEGSLWDETFGTTVFSEVRTLRYMLTEDDGYASNLSVIEKRKPDFVVMPGDLVQGGGYQPGWDEFFRHNAGEVGSGLSHRPLLPALGNWENFGAHNGGLRRARRPIASREWPREVPRVL